MTMARRRYPEADPIHHVHHAGNSSGVVDGAAAILVASADFAQAPWSGGPRADRHDGGCRCRTRHHAHRAG